MSFEIRSQLSQPSQEVNFSVFLASISFPPLHLPENRAVVFVFDSVISFIVFDALGEAEISDLHHPLVLHQHVSSSQVPVNVIFGSQVVHSLK